MIWNPSFAAEDADEAPHCVSLPLRDCQDLGRRCALTSRRDLGLSDHARAFFHRFFPKPWQVAMVVKRSKDDPLSIGFFVRESHGGVELHSPVQEFTLERLRPHQPPPGAPE
jgi:hypothetical protein